MIPQPLADRLRYWKYTRVPTAMVHQLKRFGGPLLSSDVENYWLMGSWGQEDGRITMSRTKLAKSLAINRKTLYESLERLHAAGCIRWEQAVDKAGNPLRNVVLVSHKEMQIDSSEPQTQLLASEAHPTEEGGSHGTPGGGAHTPQGRGLQTPGGGVHRPHRTKRKEEENEEGKPKTAPAYADANRLTKEEDPLVKNEKRDENQNKSAKRGKRATPLALTTNVPRKPIDKAVETETAGRVSPKGKTKRPRSSSQAPARNPSINRLWTVWTTEIKARFPEFAVPNETPKHIGQVRHLFKQFGEEASAQIIRVAVWDWSAIKETIMVWKTKDVSIPQIGDILVVSTQLAAHVARGVTSPGRRVSSYHKKFVAEPAPSTSKREGGLSLAAQMREKYRTDR